jgi:hypothetical protein
VKCKKPRRGIKALFCANFSHSRGNFPPCQKVWCGPCYQVDELDKFHINQLNDEDGNPMYDCESDNARYKQGVDGAHLMIPFQCDLCVYRTLFKRDPTSTVADIENLRVIRRMNLDAIWSREPSTITKNYLSVNLLISSCEATFYKSRTTSLDTKPPVQLHVEIHVGILGKSTNK